MGLLKRSQRTEEPRQEPAGPTPVDVAIQCLARQPAVDRALTWLLRRPRVLQIAAFLVTQALIVGFLLRSSWTQPQQRLHSSTPAAIPGHVEPEATTKQELLTLLASYNQASISASMLNRVDLLLPYLDPEGVTLAEVQAEYLRRGRAGETHDTALTQWGIVRSTINGDSATIEMQEQWDDTTLVGGRITNSYRGQLVRNTYHLRRAPTAAGGWLITNISTTTVMR